MLIYSLIAVVALLDLISCQNADKYTDENRPYKFGFNIDGYQHRKEEKNEKGIIQGEYGFITADGYYRVTKYETDENGDFKIISQKNYYVGFPPENPTTITPPSNPYNNFRKKVPPSNEPNPNLNGQNQKAPFKNPPALTTRGPTYPLPKKTTPVPFVYRQPTKPPSLFQGQAGCSDCIIPTTKKPTTESDPGTYSVDYRMGLNSVETASENPEENERGINVGRQDKSLSNNGPSAPKSLTGNLEENKKPIGPGSLDNSPVEKPEVTQNLRKNEGQLKLNNPATNKNGNNRNRPIDLKNEKFAKFDSDVNPEKPSFGPNSDKNIIQPQKLGNASNIPGENNLLDEGKFSGVDKPEVKGDVLNNSTSRSGLSNSENFADNNTENGLLYRFNYTVDFHGHHEDGYRNGDKQGDYFFDGKDGINRKVDYLANEFGYQPNITLSDLNEDDRRRIDESNEKHEGLKGYEFKWFYKN